MKLKSYKGFTIIEVVLVLAIAGLIFLMVFIALPNMQRSQRDTQRRNDYAALSAGLIQYMTNNNGKMPTSATGLANLLNSQGQGPTGTAYTVTLTNATANGTASITAQEGVVIVKNAVCGTLTAASAVGAADGKAAYTYKQGERNFIIVGYIENTPGVYCYSSNNT